MVALTDRNCASACDAFSDAVKDLKLGKLVGARTAGIASGPGIDYLLNDNKTSLGMPKRHIIGANGEVFAGIGVPPDYFAPLTAADLSAGRDPGVDKALELLKA
jgi:carboxyl-terminal processing protease